ncbi:MAG: acetyl-CoA carboxylase biotin carboxylase subunit [Alphaproteobacteria bacterium]|nr:acetyl-CoA carboxylase biotin carboxylase subunit [Alphaproteobacteria bacterium]
MTFDSVLVANRGEIACRVMRSARDLGLRSIAVYSEADRDAPHVGIADESILIGPAPAGESYLNVERIISAARQTGAGSIHPGYGFLSENPDFAKAVIDCGMVFIGPPAETIRLMGDKAGARRLMKAASVPCVPGYDGDDQSDAALVAAAKSIGFPVMIKAAAGGGGRGMRLVTEVADLAAALPMVRSEAENAFGVGQLIIEKAVEDARHVEIQIFADNHGRVVHMGERDCSVQRRHQKVVEEAPSPVVTAELRQALGEAAVAAAKAVGYSGAGTVEFLLDASGNFYFLEMNTRLQVEHPVTEMITGLDLVALQIAVAQGEVLSLNQEDIHFDGHAMEARLYAEDPANDFLPVTGDVDLWCPANGDGVRVDTGIATGHHVSPYYDPMLAKIIAWGENREVARNRLIKAVEETVLLGVKSNGRFLAALLRADDFAQNRMTTSFLDRGWQEGAKTALPSTRDIALAAVHFLHADQKSALKRASYLSSTLLGWSSAVLPAIPLRLTCNGAGFDALATCAGPEWSITIGDERFIIAIDGHGRAMIDGRSLDVMSAFSSAGDLGLAVGGERWQFQRETGTATDDEAHGGGHVLAPMPGLVLEIHVSNGDVVKKGSTMAVLEAMKMQHRIMAPVDGIISHVAVATGARLGSGDRMFDIDETGT